MLHTATKNTRNRPVLIKLPQLQGQNPDVTERVTNLVLSISLGDLVGVLSNAVRKIERSVLRSETHSDICRTWRYQKKKEEKNESVCQIVIGSAGFYVVLVSNKEEEQRKQRRKHRRKFLSCIE
jgi:hypothetical protein